jgi:hypothetical protein
MATLLIFSPSDPADDASPLISYGPAGAWTDSPNDPSAPVRPILHSINFHTLTSLTSSTHASHGIHLPPMVHLQLFILTVTTLSRPPPRYLIPFSRDRNMVLWREYANVWPVQYLH